ncbi:hypothetical protein [Peribacillus loiseleuriae]|uniref:hypothetical protein n=1 Tax=Peribacillus loiseleuriae TaxID=1679170 RepID=UPI003D02D157
MKVQLLNELVIGGMLFTKGTIFKVRILEIRNLLNASWTYQIIEGDLAGERINPEYCLEIDDQPTQATYTEKEVESIKQHYIEQLKIEREKNYHLTQAVHYLTDQFNQKNNLEQKLNEYLEELQKYSHKITY